MKRKVCVVTGSRADYGHLKSVLEACAGDSQIILQIIATGAHLSKDWGLTYRHIQGDGFQIDAKVVILRNDDSPTGMMQSIGLACRGFAEVYQRLTPDIVVVLGDRYEILAATIAAYVAKIAVAHLHGGESTEGAWDEGFRHAITKMSHVHFTATESYRRRVIQLGEQPRNVFCFGAPGLDALKHLTYLSREQISAKLNFNLSGRAAIMTYHPETLERFSPERQLAKVLKAIEDVDMQVLFTAANADSQGRAINRMVAAFCNKNPSRYKLVEHLGQQKYMSCLRHFDLMIGNSSSGIIEAPSFALPVVNIGDRQKGRLRANNIIDVPCDYAAIKKGINLALSQRFRLTLKGMKNPYCLKADGRVGWRIKEKLKKIRVDERLLKKVFFNIGF